MSFIIKDVRVFTGESVLEPGSVIVENGIISYCGKHLPSDVLSDIPIISIPGHTLLPGLIDAHIHSFDSTYALEQSIKFGVTTVMDMHNETQHARAAKTIAQS